MQWRRAGYPVRRGKTRKQLDRTDVKVNPSVKPICEKCKVIRRNGRVMVICENLRHKQRQG
ncbi:hypothetical protein GCM10009648_42080 [Tsukamurella spumae]